MKCSNYIICRGVIFMCAEWILFGADKRYKGSHHSLTQMEMSILYVADILLPP